MTGIRLLISLVIPTFTGWAFLRWIFYRQKIPLLLTAALSFGLGFGLLAQWMLVLGMSGIKYHAWIISVPSLLTACVFLFLRNNNKLKKAKTPPREKSSNLNTPYLSNLPLSRANTYFFYLLFLFVLYYTGFVFWRALNIPVFVWDAVATIAFKAKVFFYEGRLVPLKLLPHSSYPLQVPLTETWIAFNLGRWDEQLIKIIFPFSFISYLTVHYYCLRNMTNKLWAMLGTALVVSSNLFVFFATVSYRDFTLLYYNCCTIMLLLFWYREREDSYLILAALFSGFTTFTKLEGMGYLFIHTFIVAGLLISAKESIRRKFIRFLKFIVPSFSIFIIFFLFKVFTEVPSSGRFHWFFGAETLSRIPVILKTFAKMLFLSGNWNIIWFLLLLSLVNLKRRWGRGEIRLLSVTLILFFSLYFSIALFTPNFISIAGKESSDVLPRIILHFFPLAPLLIILLNCPEGSRGRRTVPA